MKAAVGCSPIAKADVCPNFAILIGTLDDEAQKMRAAVLAASFSWANLVCVNFVFAGSVFGSTQN
jgi:hypothetical protein